MAFVALSLSTQEILETTYVSDMRIISNSNVGLLKSKLEDLINNLKIDLSDKKIGVDPDSTLTPLTELKTRVLTIQNGQLYFKNVNGTADLIKFETETVNSALVGKITTGTLVANSSITSAGLAISGTSTFTGAITANGQSNLAGSVNITGSDLTIANGSKIVAHDINAGGANGIEINNNGGNPVALFGAGGSQGATFYGQINGTVFSGFLIVINTGLFKEVSSGINSLVNLILSVDIIYI